MELWLLLVVPAVTIYWWYAVIIRKKNKALEALSGIDVQLNKRHDLIPNILKIAKRFMEHEMSLLTQVTELRAQAMSSYNRKDAEAVAKHLELEKMLQGSLGQLMVAVENYPDLKTDQTMLQAQQTYNEVEEHISAARRFYNAAVTDLNNSIQIFPGNLIAKLASAKEMPFFTADEGVKKGIDANSYL